MSAYRNLWLVVLVLLLYGCGGAPAVMPGDVLALQSGTSGWVLSTAVTDTSKYVLSLQSTLYPTQIVSFAKVAGGFGMAGVDLGTQKEITGTWISSGQDLTSILKAALSKGNWKIISRDEVAKLIATYGTTGGPVLLQWIAALTLPMEVVTPGVFVLPGSVLDDTLRGIGFTPSKAE